MTCPTTGLVLVGAGTARRMGGTDKIWTDLGVRPMLWYSWNTLAPLVDHCVLVVRPDCLERARQLVGDHSTTLVVPGGVERQASVAAGLNALPSVDVVAVHDVARPLVAIQLLQTGIELAHVHGAATPVVRLTDTVKRIAPNGQIIETVDRDSLRGAQTPQVFQAPILCQAHERARTMNLHATDDADLVYRALQQNVVTFPGDPRNLKVTTRFDLEIARFLLLNEASQ